jgi:hypothetical protein
LQAKVVAPKRQSREGGPPLLDDANNRPGHHVSLL